MARRKARQQPEAPAELVVVAGGNLALIYFNAKKTRLTLEEIDELYPNLVEALANHPGIGVLMVRSRDHGLLLVGKRGINFVDEGRIDGEDPMALYGEFGVAGFKRLDEIAHVGDLAVISFYDPETEEIAAFEELIGAHGGLGGAQTRPFLLYPADWELDLAPLVGAPMVYQQLRRWMEQHLGFTLRPCEGFDGGGRSAEDLISRADSEARAVAARSRSQPVRKDRIRGQEEGRSGSARPEGCARPRRRAQPEAPSPGPEAKMKTKAYEQEMRRLHGELVAMQEWVKATRRQGLRRLRGSRHRRQGRHHQADHRAGQPSRVQGRGPLGPDRAREVADVHPALPAPTSRPPARSSSSIGAGTTGPASSG